MFIDRLIPPRFQGEIVTLEAPAREWAALLVLAAAGHAAARTLNDKDGIVGKLQKETGPAFERIKERIQGALLQTEMRGRAAARSRRRSA